MQWRDREVSLGRWRAKEAAAAAVVAFLFLYSALCERVVWIEVGLMCACDVGFISKRFCARNAHKRCLGFLCSAVYVTYAFLHSTRWKNNRKLVKRVRKRCNKSEYITTLRNYLYAVFTPSENTSSPNKNVNDTIAARFIYKINMLLIGITERWSIFPDHTVMISFRCAQTIIRIHVRDARAVSLINSIVCV